MVNQNIPPTGHMFNKTRRRRHRRLIHDSFHPAAALRFRPFSIKATRNLLNRFLDVPGDVLGNLRQYVNYFYEFSCLTKRHQAWLEKL